jgi:NADH-quinone oxidoreductase subunit M
MQGVMIQMFNHGINTLGMWIVVDLIERQFGTRKISELGGLAQKAPGLAILLMIVALGNIALPLTNSFVGEFLLFNGVYGSTATQYNVVFTVVAMLSVILSAVYTLDIKLNEKLALVVIVGLIVFIGVYPRPVLELTKETTDFILMKMNFKQ